MILHIVATDLSVACLEFPYLCSTISEARLQNWQAFAKVIEIGTACTNKCGLRLTDTFWSRSVGYGPKLLGPLTPAHWLANNKPLGSTSPL